MTLRDEIAASVIAMAAEISGVRTPIDEAQFVGRDLAIEGWDCVDFLEEIEDRWKVDLKPWIETITEYRRGWFRKRMETRDATLGELIDQVTLLRS